MTEIVTARHIIERLGGPSAVADKLGLKPHRVIQWQLRGRIPGDYYRPLLDLARREMVWLSVDELINHLPAGRRKGAEPAGARELSQ